MTGRKRFSHTSSAPGGGASACEMAPSAMLASVKVSTKRSRASASIETVILKTLSAPGHVCASRTRFEKALVPSYSS